jgi:hypothetical protein
MTGRYDEWEAARTPALLRLARALTYDERRAEEAVHRALDRVRGAWLRVAGGDPDLEVRRVMVRECGSRDRAALALRRLEARSDDEIAEVLGCSVSAARRHVQRGIAAGASPYPVLRAADAEGGGLVPDGVTVGVLERRVADEAEPPARRRGRATWTAALAVLLLVGGVAYVAHQSRTPAGVIRYPAPDVPRAWRYESYAGVQVQVPPTWGWGGSPIHSDIFHGKDSLGSCGSAQAAVQSPDDPGSYISSVTGFTGRPAVMSDLCMSWGSDGIMPTGDALWFASPLEVGVKDVGGIIAETRVVGDQRVTVFSDHAALRRQILGTATLVGDTDANGCPTRPVLRPSAGPQGLRPTSMSVCVYSQDSGTAVLLWSGRVERHAADYAGSVDTASESAGTSCPETPAGTWVALGLRADNGTRWDVVDLSCSRIRLADGREAPLAPATVEVWAAGAVTAYVPEPSTANPALRPFFRPPAG